MAVAADFVTPVTQLYIALFNRVPDTAGLAFWTQALADGASLETVTQGFLTAPEGQATYSPFLADEDFVADFYATVFGRAADEDGLAFWTAALAGWGGAQSSAARAQLVAAIVELVSQPLDDQPEGMSDAAYDETLLDRKIFADKVEVGAYYGASLNTSEDVAKGPGLDLGRIDGSETQKDLFKSTGFGFIWNAVTVAGTSANDVFNVSGSGGAFTGSIDGRGGIDTVILRNGVTVAESMFKNIEVVRLDGYDNSRFDASLVAGLSTVEVATGGLTIEGASGKTLVLRASAIDGATGPDVTVELDDDTTAVAVTLAGSAADSAITFDGSDQLTSATVSGEGSVNVYAGLAATKLKTLNIASEGAGIVVQTVAGFSAVDASTSTADVAVTLGAGIAYTGGAGVDTVTLTGATGATIAGGAGDRDVLVANASTDVLAGAQISGFEILALGADAQGEFTATGYQTLRVDSSLDADVVFVGVDAGATLSLTAPNTGVIGYQLATDTKADVLNIEVDVPDVAGTSVGLVRAQGIETIDIAVSAIDHDGIAVLGLESATTKSLTVSGDGGLFVNFVLGPSGPASDGLTALTSFDASAVDGRVGFLSTNATVGASVSIAGSATGTNFLVGSLANETIVGGAGSDLLVVGTLEAVFASGGGDIVASGLDTLTGGEGPDIFAVGRNANAQVYTTITDFGKDDVLMFKGVFADPGGATYQEGLVRITLAPTATLNQYLDAATSVYAEDTFGLAWFQFGGDTYVVADQNGGVSGFQNGLDTGDQLIKLAGLIDLTGVNLQDGVMTFLDPATLPDVFKDFGVFSG